MCGIAGIFLNDAGARVDERMPAAMGDALAHRGPDGAGIWAEPGIGLAHRRLSVIDLEGSPQPMHAQSGNAVITFNGEIYNFRALRSELEAEGARFATDGDTEVILAAYERWGPDCLQRLDGMFAFALWDKVARQLFIARDRLGVKPLYYARRPDGGFAFASELKALLVDPSLKRRLCPRALDAYFAWGFVPDDRSILEGVHKLPAGHFMLARAGEAQPRIERWWDVSFEDRHAGRQSDLAEELTSAMQSAVASRMVADVPLGAFLSGGVDSSSVVALMSERSSAPVTTCSIGFDARGLDETDYAQQIAELFSTRHFTRTVSADDFSALDRLAGIFDEPFADASALPTLRVCELARGHVTVALSGDGADEAFAGYRRQVFHHHEDRLRSVLPEAMRASIFGALGRLWPRAQWAPRMFRAKSTFTSLAKGHGQAYAHSLAITDRAERAQLYGRKFMRALEGRLAEDDLAALIHDAPGQSALDKAQYADLKFFLPGDILTKVDRTSMAVGLEAREPLLDHRLVEFAARLPESHRVSGRQGKALLKQSMQAYLPRDILYRPKQGFVTPIAQWLKGPLSGEALALADSAQLVAAGWLDKDFVRSAAEQHAKGQRDHSRLLWQILVFERSVGHLGLEL